MSVFGDNIIVDRVLDLSTCDLIPEAHKQYLYKLRNEGFNPKVIYDIGSCVLSWTNVAKNIWPDATIILFDAFPPAEILYKDNDYYIGVLSDEDDKVIKFYQNDYYPTGNSYYREIGHSGNFFPADKYVEYISKKLDTVVKENSFPLPDFVKIDVQGAEIDVIRGGTKTLNHAQKLIVELQHIEYNEGALLCNESIPIIEGFGWKCTDPLFQNNGCDGDYGFCKI
jgi:FkbM family methyltransferase